MPEGTESASHWPVHFEQDLVPYRASELDGIESILVLAPHPDDEVLGCGGLLALASARGIQIRVVVVTDGDKAGDPASRRKESLKAAEVLGGEALRDSLEFWHLPDRGLTPAASLVQLVGERIDQTRSGWVLAPSLFEAHPDHRAVCLAAIDAVSARQAMGRTLSLAFFEVGAPLMVNILVDITSVARLKFQAMQCFQSQLQQQAYDVQIDALNRYRAYTLGPRVSHAEAFTLVSPEELADGALGVIESIGNRVKARL